MKLHETFHFSTIKGSIFYNIHNDNSALIIIDGFINDFSVGNLFKIKLLEIIKKDRYKLVIDCTQLTYLADTAGGSQFSDIMRLLFSKGLKLVLLNCTNEFLNRDYRKDFIHSLDFNVENHGEYFDFIRNIMSNENIFEIK